VSDAGLTPCPMPEGNRDSKGYEFAHLLERLRHSSEHLPAERTSYDDLKLLSQTLRELRCAFSVFAPYRAQRKLTIFGSARTARDAPAYRQAMELGRAMVEQGWLVVTGASTGIMEAGHRGAGRDHSMGLNILLPFEQDANEVIRGDHKLVTMKYFFTRKLMFVKECDAVVCLPGGFGTMDEAFEVLTLLQTGKRELMPVVLLDAPDGTFWRDWSDFVQSHLLSSDMISADDLSLFSITDDVEDAVTEVTRFYRMFHSMRFENDRLVLRLRGRLSDSQLSAIQRDFADILAEGRFALYDPPTEEREDPILASLVHLVFSFNRRSHGRLRQLIDRINR
jgi:uncharacterized protein (TIGR00730 family)